VPQLKNRFRPLPPPHARPPLIGALLALALLSGCGDWPTLVIPNQTDGATQDWPDLVPVGPLLDRASVPPTVAAPPAGRVAALNARAAAIRARPILDPASRARLEGGVDPAALAALN
jgi:hypothetical protein